MPTRKEWLKSAEQSKETIEKVRNESLDEEENAEFLDYMERKRDWQNAMAQNAYDDQIE
jgi:hypothetical protein